MVTGWRDLLASRLFFQPISAHSLRSSGVSVYAPPASDQTSDFAPETQSKILNSIEASFKLYFLSGNKSKDPPSLISSNFEPLVTPSTSALHVGSAMPAGATHRRTPADTATHRNAGAAQGPHEPRINPTGTPLMILSTERRKARTIQICPRHFVDKSPPRLNISTT